MSPRDVIPYPTMLCDDQELLDTVIAALRPIPWPRSGCVPAGRAVTAGTLKLAKKPAKTQSAKRAPAKRQNPRSKKR